MIVGVGLLSMVLAGPSLGEVPAGRKRPFPEYKVGLGARDPFGSATGETAMGGASSALTGQELKAHPNAEGVPAELAERLVVQSVAVGSQGADLAIINGIVVKVGEKFAINLGEATVELTLLAVSRDPPQVRLRWGSQEFVRFLKPREER